LEDKSPEIRIQAAQLLLSFYPSTSALVEACCQKFKKAAIAASLMAARDTQSTPERAVVANSPLYQKTSEVNMHIHPRHQQIHVSGQGNNCGLFALVLGTKKSLENKPQLRAKTRLPDFFDKIDATCLGPNNDAQETVEMGIKLRQEMAAVLLKDTAYKARRYQHFIAACSAFLEDNPPAPDMQAWLTVTRDYRSALKKAWFEISDVLEKSYATVEADYRQLLVSHPLKLEDIEPLKAQLSKAIIDKPEPKDLSALLASYDRGNRDSIIDFIQLRRLYRAAWLMVTSGTGLERNVASESMEVLFKQKTLVLLQKQDASKVPETLLLLSLVEKTHFDKNGALVGNGLASREEVLSSVCALFVEKDLSAQWDMIYKMYVEHIKTTTEMLSADELGALANYWQIGLKIQFAEGEAYTTGETETEQLQVTLCNPTQTHWNVVCESGVQFEMKWECSKIVGLILGIENIEYKSHIMEAINNESAYARRCDDCSYVMGVISAIQDRPEVLSQQGAPLSTVDLKTAARLSEHFEQGLLRLNAERIYFLKGFLSKEFFETLLVSVAEYPEPSTAQNPLFFDYSNAPGSTVRSRQPVETNRSTMATGTREAHYFSGGGYSGSG
jgi:hypothetical protein